MRRLTLLALLALRCAAVSEEERLPGWGGEVPRAPATQQAPPSDARWIEPISWRPRYATLALLLWLWPHPLLTLAHAEPFFITSSCRTRSTRT